MSDPKARPWEAEHLGGRKEVLIQTLEAAVSKSFPGPLPVHKGCCPGCLGQLSRTFPLLEHASPCSHHGLIVTALFLWSPSPKYSHSGAIVP